MNLDDLKKQMADELMPDYIEQFREAIRRGESEVRFRDLDREDNPDDRRALNNVQAELLRTKGYKVTYDKFLSEQWGVGGWAE